MSNIFKTQRSKFPLRMVGDVAPRNNRFFNPAYYNMIHRPTASELVRYPQLFTGFDDDMPYSFLSGSENVANERKELSNASSSKQSVTSTKHSFPSKNEYISGHSLAANFLGSFEMSPEWSNLLSESSCVTPKPNCEETSVQTIYSSVTRGVEKAVHVGTSTDKKLESWASSHHHPHKGHSSYKGVQCKNVNRFSAQTKQMTSVPNDSKHDQVVASKIFSPCETMDEQMSSSHRLKIHQSNVKNEGSIVNACVASQIGTLRDATNCQNIHIANDIPTKKEQKIIDDKRISTSLSNVEVFQNVPACEDGFQLVSRKDRSHKKKSYGVTSAVSVPKGQHPRLVTQRETASQIKVTKSDRPSNYNKEEVVTSSQSHHRISTSSIQSQRISPKCATQLNEVKKNEISSSRIPSFTSKSSPWAPTNLQPSNEHSKQWTNRQIDLPLAITSEASLSSLNHSYDSCSSFFMDKWNSFLHDFSRLRENYPDLVDTF